MTPQERLKILYERVRDFRINDDQVLSVCGARNDRLRVSLRAANERAERAEAQLPLPTELVRLKPLLSMLA